MPRALGQVTTSAGTKVPVYETTYTEQTSGAQRSLVSSSANDSADGTGIQQVKITYYTLASNGAIAGPFSEIVTMDGETAVPTVGTEIALIEKLEAVAVGSGGVAAGTISLYEDAAGETSAFASIAAGDVRTRYAHHYVPSNRSCEVSDLECIGGNATAALVEIDALAYPPGVELPVTGGYGTTSTLPRAAQFADAPHAIIPGPARVRALVTPGNNTSQTTTASFGYVDRATQAF